MDKESYKPTILPPDKDPANPDNWEHQNYQGFPGEVRARKLTEKQKGWVIVAQIVFLGIWAWVIIKYIIL